MGTQRVFVLAVVVTTLFAFGASADIVFTDHPVDRSVEEGDSVLCPCGYNGTNDLPLWRINGTSYIVTNVPYGFSSNQLGLVFSALLYLNNTSFQCYFLSYDPMTGEIKEVLSDIGVVTISLGINSTFPEDPLETCKPTMTEITVSGASVGFTWVANTDQSCKNLSYFAQLATCGRSIPPTDVCDISPNTTYTVIDTNSDCQNLNFGQPLVFRVESEGCQDTENNCYTSYQYLPSLKDTVQVSALAGTGYRHYNLQNDNPTSEKCLMPKVCISNPPRFPTVCARPPQMFTNVPGGYRFCYNIITQTLDLCIDNVTQALDGAVHTIKCAREISCSIGGADVVLNTFQLEVCNAADSCLLEVLGSFSDTANLICQGKGFAGGRQVPHGRVCYTGVCKQSNATFFCDDGYYVEGSNTETCGANQEWSDNITCTAVPEPTCPGSERRGSTATIPCEGSTNNEINFNDEADMWDDCPSCDSGSDLSRGAIAGIVVGVVVLVAIVGKLLYGIPI